MVVKEWLEIFEAALGRGFVSEVIGRLIIGGRSKGRNYMLEYVK